MLRALAATHPDAHCELDFRTPLELAVATDPVRAEHRQAGQHGHARALRPLPHRAGLRQGRSRRAGGDDPLHRLLPEQGELADRAGRRRGRAARRRAAAHARGAREAAGIGRKTANVILGNAFDIPGITVDTHFGRLVRRWGWTAEEDPVKVEHADRRAGAQARLDDRVAPGDLPRAAGLPRSQAGLRRLHPGRRVPGLRHRPHRSQQAAALVKGPSRGHLLAMVGLSVEDAPAPVGGEDRDAP